MRLPTEFELENRMQSQPFPFPRIDQLSPALQQEVTSRRGLHVYQMVMHSPGIAPAFLGISDALRHQSSLPPTWRELAILRVGHCYGAAYEVHHHQILARKAGLTEAEIAATHPSASQDALDATGQRVLQWTDQLLTEHGLDETTRQQALQVLSVNQLADLVFTVGFYQLVCNFLNTFGVPIEA